MLEGEAINGALQHWAIIGASISAILGALALIYKKIIVPTFNHFTEWYKMIDKIETIYEEVTPNDGGSIKDIINKIDNKVNYISERQKSLLQEHEYALVETDAAGEVVWVNRTYTRLVQRERSEVMRTGWINVIAKEDRERVWNEWERAVEEKREINLYFSFETPGGDKIPVRAKSYILTGEGSCTCNKSKSKRNETEILGYLATVEVLNRN